jgi:hypothetical protein
MLKIECLRDCDWGSVEARASLDIGGGGGSVTSAVREGARADESILGFVGTSCEVLGDASSGFAMRKPPKD